MVTPRLRAAASAPGHHAPPPPRRRPPSARASRHPARVRVEVLDQPRRRIGVEVIDERLVADVDLLALQERRHRNDDGELLQVALEVVGHRHHRAIAVAHQHDLRGLVEQLGVGLGDVEAAEAEQRRRRPGDQRRERRRRTRVVSYAAPFDGRRRRLDECVDGAPCDAVVQCVAARPAAASRSAAPRASTPPATRAARWSGTAGTARTTRRTRRARRTARGPRASPASSSDRKS